MNMYLFVHDANREEGDYAKSFFGDKFLYLNRHYDNEINHGLNPNHMMYFKCDLEWLE